MLFGTTLAHCSICGIFGPQGGKHFSDVSESYDRQVDSDSNFESYFYAKPIHKTLCKI